jgi:hypothetical protein
MVSVDLVEQLLRAELAAAEKRVQDCQDSLASLAQFKASPSYTTGSANVELRGVTAVQYVKKAKGTARKTPAKASHGRKVRTLAPKPPQSTPKRRKLSPAARKAIGDAQRARWAAVRAAKAAKKAA